MFIKKEDFLRKIPVRTLKTFTQRFHEGLVDAPLYSIYHFHDDSEKLGPSPQDGVVSLITANDENADSRIYVENIVELHKDNLHGRSAKTTLMRSADQRYHKMYPQFRKVIRLERVLEKRNNELIFNYNMISEIYPWVRRNRLNNYNQYASIHDTIITTATGLGTDRIQFISINLPRTIPTNEELKLFLHKETADVLSSFSSQNTYNLIKFYRYVMGLDVFPAGDDSNIIFRISDGLNSIYVPVAAIDEYRADEPTDSVAFELVNQIVDAFVEKRVAVVPDNVEVKTDVKVVSGKVSEPQTPFSSAQEYLVKKETAITSLANEAYEEGLISSAVRDGQIKLSNRYKTIPSPDGKGTVEDLLKYSQSTPRSMPESTVPDLAIVRDKSTLNNRVALMDKEYKDKFEEADRVETIMMLQNHGISVLDIKKEHVKDAASEYTIYKVQVKPLRGEISTFEFVNFDIDDTGVFKYGNVECRMAKQKFGFPIVKSSPRKVNLTSSHSKFFVETERNQASNYSEWLNKQLRILIMDGTLTDVNLGNSFDRSAKVDIVESTLRMTYKKFTFGDFKYDVSGKDTFTYKGKPVEVKDSVFYADNTSLGTLEDILGLETRKEPRPFAETELAGAYVSVGMLLSYWLGMKKFFDLIGCSYVEYEPKQRVEETRDNVILKFKDVKVVVNTSTLLQKYLVNGIQHFKNSIKLVEFDSLDKKKGYPLVLAGRGISRRQELAYKSLRNGWVDPVTFRKLESRSYPTDMVGILIKTVEMLTDHNHTNENDVDNSYIRGYSRTNDILYREMMKSLAEFERNPSAKRRFTMNPRAVEQAILSDAAVSPIETSSPSGLISNQNRIVHTGSGGRSNQTMNAKAREFDKSEMGIISESGTDDGKAGTVLYYSLNPNIVDLYGTPDREGEKNLGNILCAQTMTHPFSTRDDMKRTIFLRIQGNSIAPTIGNALMPIRTPVDLVIAHQCGDVFTLPTLAAGKVTELTDKFIEITYKDGTVKRMGLGEKISTNSGHMYSRMIVTDRRKGYVFEKGEIIAWDSMYFERDIIYPTQVAAYVGDPTIMALRETDATYEDSTANSAEVASKSKVPVIHCRDLKAEYDNNLKLKIKVGDHVNRDDIIAYLTPAGVEITDDETSIDYISMSSPKAESRGEIIRIECFYNGDYSEASDTVKAIINKTNRERKEESHYDSKVAPAGEVRTPTYIGTQFLSENSIVLRIYIRHEDVMSVGDKNSYATALKSIPGKIYSKPITTMKGTKIGGYFSGMGIFRRVITSAEGVMHGGTYLRQAGLNAAKLYRGESLDE